MPVKVFIKMMKSEQSENDLLEVLGEKPNSNFSNFCKYLGKIVNFCFCRKI
jgi:hypothetical protein